MKDKKLLMNCQISLRNRNKYGGILNSQEIEEVNQKRGTVENTVFTDWKIEELAANILINHIGAFRELAK